MNWPRIFRRRYRIAELTPLQRGLIASAERMGARVRPGAAKYMSDRWRADYAVRNGSPLTHVKDANQ